MKKLAHASEDAQFIQLQKYNSVVAGLHEYYGIATEASHDFGRLAFDINKQLRNRLKGDLSKTGYLKDGFIKQKYGQSRQLDFFISGLSSQSDMRGQRMPNTKERQLTSIRRKVGN